MSYFSKATDHNGSTETETPETDWVSEVAKTKGENWKDPKVIAKGYLDSQNFINQIKDENKQLREDLDRLEYEKEVLERLGSKAKPTGGEENSESASTSATENRSGASVDDIKKLVQEAITERERSATAGENLRSADQQLEQMFGTDADAQVEARRKELGLTKERLMEIAAESPSAFMTLMGKAPEKQTNRSMQGSVNTSAESFTSNSSKRNWRYYQELRKENPKLYRKPATQNQMARDRLELGESFFN